jgi:hypothetical protein
MHFLAARKPGCGDSEVYYFWNVEGQPLMMRINMLEHVIVCTDNR